MFKRSSNRPRAVRKKQVEDDDVSEGTHNTVSEGLTPAYGGDQNLEEESQPVIIRSNAQKIKDRATRLQRNRSNVLTPSITAQRHDRNTTPGRFFDETATGQALYSASYLAELRKANSRAGAEIKREGNSGDEGVILTADDLEETEEDLQEHNEAAGSSKAIESLDFISLDDSSDFGSRAFRKTNRTLEHDEALSHLGSTQQAKTTRSGAKAPTLPTIGKPAVEEDVSESEDEVKELEPLTTQWEQSQIQRSGGVLGFMPAKDPVSRAARHLPAPRAHVPVIVLQSQLSDAISAHERDLRDSSEQMSNIELTLTSMQYSNDENLRLESQKTKFEFFASLEVWLQTCASLMTRKLPVVSDLEALSLSLAADLSDQTMDPNALQAAWDAIGEDVDVEFRVDQGIAKTCHLFEQWRTDYWTLYDQSFAESSLCSLLQFWIRWEMAIWQPLRNDSAATLSTFTWLKAVCQYAAARAPVLQAKDEQTDDIVSECITQVLLPRLSAFAPYFHRESEAEARALAATLETIKHLLVSGRAKEAYVKCGRDFGISLDV